jgi:hypothetical protein
MDLAWLSPVILSALLIVLFKGRGVEFFIQMECRVAANVSGWLLLVIPF